MQVYSIANVPDRSSVKEVKELRAQLALALKNNHVLKLACQVAQAQIQMSRVKETAFQKQIQTSRAKEKESHRQLHSAREEIEKIHAELQKERENNSKCLVEMRAMQEKIKTLSGTLADAQSQMQFAKMNHNHTPSNVGYSRKKNLS